MFQSLPFSRTQRIPSDLLKAGVVFVCALGILAGTSARGGTLSDPEVDAYNVRGGTQTFSGLYQFTTNSLLVETAEAINGMGSDIIKLYLGSNFPRQYHEDLPANVTNLLTLVRDYPPCRRVFDMPFRHVIAWAYPFGNADAPFVNGYVPAEAAADYRELYDLTQYLLTHYNNSGRTFYLGHWEGDGYFTPWTTNPSPTAIQGMIGWLNNRQKAIDDAKAATSHTNVSVFCYAEANRVRDAMLNGPTNNQRVINRVIPYVTNLDYLSYSSYDAMNLSVAELYRTLDYMHSMLPTNKAAAVPGERLWIGEYGWGGSQTADQQEPTTRAYLQRLLNYPQAPPYILFWEIYNNETNKTFCLIDSNNVKVASYFLHQRFINRARLATAQFKETNGRLPNDAEFVSLVSPMLNQPLPAAVGLSVSNAAASVSSASTATVSGSLAQGIYGDDRASVWVFYGTQDGGLAPSGWQQGAYLGVNTNFNRALFQARLANLAANTNYYYRFYATNANSSAWSPAAGVFSTSLLNPADFGSRLRLTFSGYGRPGPVYDTHILVRLGTNVQGFSYRQFASPQGGDLRFADSTGLVPLDYEIDEWDTNGTSSVWVRVPEISGPADSILAYWGNPRAVSSPASSMNGRAWSGDHFLVWHLKEGGFPYLDSATQHPALSGVAPGTGAGVVGRACTFNGSSEYLNGGAINCPGGFTLSAWVKVDPTASDIQTIWANKAGGWYTAGFALYVNHYQTADGALVLETGNGTTGTTASTGTNALTPGQWHHVAAAVDPTSGRARLFVDGVDQTGQSSIQPDLATQAMVNLGRFTNGAFLFKGSIDEARIASGAQSADRIWADYVSTRPNGGLVDYSAVTQAPPVVSLSKDARGAFLCWESPGVGFTVETATNLLAPIFWGALPGAPVFSNGLWQVLLSAPANGSCFFRLRSP